MMMRARLVTTAGLGAMLASAFALSAVAQDRPQQDRQKRQQQQQQQQRQQAQQGQNPFQDVKSAVCVLGAPESQALPQTLLDRFEQEKMKQGMQRGQQRQRGMQQGQQRQQQGQQGQQRQQQRGQQGQQNQAWQQVERQGSAPKGVVLFREEGGNLIATGVFDNLEPNKEYQLFLHEQGDLSSKTGASLGGIYTGKQQSGQKSDPLLEVSTDGQGVAAFRESIRDASIAGQQKPILGRGLALHAKQQGQQMGSATQRGASRDQEERTQPAGAERDRQRRLSGQQQHGDIKAVGVIGIARTEGN